MGRDVHSGFSRTNATGNPPQGLSYVIEDTMSGGGCGGEPCGPSNAGLQQMELLQGQTDGVGLEGEGESVQGVTTQANEFI
jgi:hypothetical protein